MSKAHKLLYTNPRMARPVGATLGRSEQGLPDFCKEFRLSGPKG
jgi:hypothetical protein